MSKITSQAEDSLGFTYPGNRATNFLQLTDTPDDYTGKGGKAVTVKTDESGLEFTTGTGGGSASAFTDLTDVPSTYSGSALKVVQVNSGATGLDFVTLGGGGDALTSNPLSQFAATTSAQLRSVLSDETGTGAAYFAGGNAGTPSAINLANATALPQTAIVGSTSISIGIGLIELGHANDTTISRLSAGIAAVEGNAILTAPNISDAAYDATTWNNDSTHAPSKNAIRDKIEALSLTGNDANNNASANNFLHSVATITASASPVTLTVASAYEQRVTGSTTQTIKLPAVSTLALGHTFLIRNLSSGIATIQSSGSNTIATLPQDTAATVSSNAVSGTTASVWDVISNATVLTTSAIDDTIYDATAWNGDTTHAPSKNAVRDKIESLAGISVSDAVYDATAWDGVTTVAPSKNAVRDKIEALSLGGGNVSNSGTPTSGQLAGWVSSSSIQGQTTGTGVLTALGVNTGSAGAVVVNGGALGTPSSGTLSSCTTDGTNLVGYRGIPQNSQTAAYTTVLADAGKCVFHPSSDNNARTFTIDSNANVAYPVGTVIEFINMAAASATIAITSDTMTLLPAGTTGSRTLAQYGRCNAEKIASTAWVISGNTALT